LLADAADDAPARKVRQSGSTSRGAARKAG
jgi:hypothetical protein